MIQNLITSEFFKILITLVMGFIASTGFWAFISKRFENRNLERQLLIGLAHDRIVYLAMKYIERGWLTQDEYENLCEYLYAPYVNIGGNGAAKRLMAEVDKLRLKTVPLRNITAKENDNVQQ